MPEAALRHDLLQQVINVLAVPAALQPQNKDHSLTGSYIPHRECHIQRIGC